MGSSQSDSFAIVAEILSRRQRIPFDEAVGDFEYQSIEETVPIA